MAIKEDIEKLFMSDNMLFRESIIIILLFKERRTPVIYYKYRRFGYRAKDCTRPDICKIYRQEGYL